jgi:hypothetical protein
LAKAISSQDSTPAEEREVQNALLEYFVSKCLRTTSRLMGLCDVRDTLFEAWVVTLELPWTDLQAEAVDRAMNRELIVSDLGCSVANKYQTSIARRCNI